MCIYIYIYYICIHIYIYIERERYAVLFCCAASAAEASQNVWARYPQVPKRHMFDHAQTSGNCHFKTKEMFWAMCIKIERER